MSASKRKGTAWETAVVDYLRQAGHPHVERRALAGASDRGDIAGIPGVVIECKNAKAVTLAKWTDELTREKANDHATHAVLVVKRRGRPVADAYAVMPFSAWLALHEEASR